MEYQQDMNNCVSSPVGNHGVYLGKALYSSIALALNAWHFTPIAMALTWHLTPIAMALTWHFTPIALALNAWHFTSLAWHSMLGTLLHWLGIQCLAFFYN